MRAVATPVMDGQLRLQDQLLQRFSKLKEKNSNYTLRAYARKLGIHSGALSAILNGKRRVSRKMALRLAERLMLDPIEMDKIAASFEIKTDERILPRALQLSADQHRLIVEWYHYGILSLIQLKGFRNDSVWIAKRLNIRPSEARDAVARLIRLGLVERSGKNSLKRIEARVATTDGVRSSALQRAHAQNLELAQTSLDRDPLAVRDFTSLTFPADPAKISIARRLIRRCQDQIEAEMQSASPTEVYRVCVQLFPLTDTTGVDT